MPVATFMCTTEKVKYMYVVICWLLKINKKAYPFGVPYIDKE